MSKTHRVWLLAVSVVTAVVVGEIGGSRSARACVTILEPPALRGTPADGETDVPTDVVPVYNVTAAQMRDVAAQLPTFSLVDDAGTTVAATFKASYLNSFEVVPATSLRPLARYTLTGTWTSYSATTTASVTIQLAFTTGAGAFAGSLAAPPAFLQHYLFQNVRATTCDPRSSGTCVSVPALTLNRVSYLDRAGREWLYSSGAGEPRADLLGGSFFSDLTGGNPGLTCVKLVARAPDGTLSSDATVVCGDGAPTFAINGSAQVGCSPQGLTHDDILVAQNPSAAHHLLTPPDHGQQTSFGCSVAPARSVGGGWAPLLLLLAVAAARGALRSRAAGCTGDRSDR